MGKMSQRVMSMYRHFDGIASEWTTTLRKAALEGLGLVSLVFSL